MAIYAGVDLLVYANQQTYNANIFNEVLDDVTALVRGGHLTEAEIDQAVQQVDKLRPAK
jgi:beta-N-acetylhexosaminidase